MIDNLLHHAPLSGFLLDKTAVLRPHCRLHGHFLTKDGGRMANVVINYQPTPKQAMFHASKANEILYGGAAGGGKRRRSSWMRSSGA
jgi:hypothetical protein